MAQWTDYQSTASSASSRRSDGSDSGSGSSSNGSTYHRTPASEPAVPQSARPPLPKPETWHAPTDYYYSYHDDDDRAELYDEPSVSVETFLSTSEEELDESGSDDEDDEDDDYTDVQDDYPPYELLEHRPGHFECDVVPASPSDFAKLFPSDRRLLIQHDDTLDGNMNLRIDTRVESPRGYQAVTLFHLRMRDLRTRDFSLRRYCRDSGREVCHAVRQYRKPPADRPALQRSLSSAIATLRHKGPAPSGLRRQDSGYGSIGDEDSAAKRQANRVQPKPTKTIKMEFSNYAHVDIKRCGANSSKRYDFEYWGVQYSWRRVAEKDVQATRFSYHLTRSDHPNPLAHIVPATLTPTQARDEKANGGWIPRCWMSISDESIITGSADTADVIVSSGIMTLVDDSIMNHFHSKDSAQVRIPLSKKASFRLNMDYVGPKRLIDEVFHRTGRGNTSSRRPSPLRRTLAEP